MSSWRACRTLSALVVTAAVSLSTAADAAAILNTVLKAVGNTQLLLAVNFAQWSGNFNYSVVLPASELFLPHHARQ